MQEVEEGYTKREKSSVVVFVVVLVAVVAWERVRRREKRERRRESGREGSGGFMMEDTKTKGEGENKSGETHIRIFLGRSPLSPTLPSPFSLSHHFFFLYFYFYFYLHNFNLHCWIPSLHFIGWYESSCHQKYIKMKMKKQKQKQR